VAPGLGGSIQEQQHQYLNQDHSHFECAPQRAALLRRCSA
jgi:hypothetical protein